MGSTMPPWGEVTLAFGTERGGLSDTLRARAARSVSIPMRAGVSSLNLATSVAIVLFCGAGGMLSVSPPSPSSSGARRAASSGPER